MGQLAQIRLPRFNTGSLSGNATNGTIPRRFPYPVEEVAKNGANQQEAAAAIPGGDNLTGRVWWDKP